MRSGSFFKPNMPALWRSHRGPESPGASSRSGSGTSPAPVERYCAPHAPPFKALLVLDRAPLRPGNLDDFSDDVRVEDLPTDAPALSQPASHPRLARHVQGLLSAEGLPCPAGEGQGRRAVQRGPGGAGAGAAAGGGRGQLAGHLAKGRAQVDAGLRGIRDNDPQPERSPRICPALNEVSRYRQLLRKERGPRWRVDGGGGTLEVLTPPDCWGRWYSLFSFHMEVTLA